MHSIAAMRQFSEDVYLAPFEAKKKIFIIDDAERMLPFSSNALLKTFEEPALDAVIILVSSNPTALLPTVLSRCRTIRFHPLTTAEIASYLFAEEVLDATAAQKAALLAHGSLGKALRYVREGESPMRMMLLDMLAGGGVATYKQLTAMAAQIADSIDEAKKGIEENLRASIVKGYEQSAIQKQSLEKEIEGAIAVYTSQEANGLFDIIIGWYRDLQLRRVNGNPAYLMHVDYAEESSKSSQTDSAQPLEALQKALADARFALQRSTPVQTCFENLFLKINLLRYQPLVKVSI
jgi:DNA polymerase-3 subunit delta'